MPKEYRDRRTFAQDKSTGLYERIIVHKATRQKFARVGAPHRTKYPRIITPKTHSLSLEERLSFTEYHQENLATSSLLSRLTLERRKLQDRIDNPPPTLADRIRDPLPEPEIHIPPPIPSTIRFHRTKLLHRIKEYEPMLEATLDRFLPLFRKLQDDDEKEFTGEDYRVPRSTRNELWGLFLGLQGLYLGLDEIGHDLTNAEWRKLKGALKRLGKFELKSINTQLPEICERLKALNITLP